MNVEFLKELSLYTSNKKLVSVASQTAAEIIYDRADSEKEFMGLTSFKGADVTLEDVRIAKNYLSEKELKKLSALVSAFFDIAEYQAENHNEMHMSDYVEQLDRTIQSVGEEVLEGVHYRTSLPLILLASLRWTASRVLQSLARNSGKLSSPQLHKSPKIIRIFL